MIELIAVRLLNNYYFIILYRLSVLLWINYRNIRLTGNSLFRLTSDVGNDKIMSMKKFKYFFAVLILAAVSSCGAVPETEASRELFAMDTIISVKAYGQRSEEAVNAAADRLKELEDLFSVTDINSDIGKLNTLGSANVSDDTAYVISEAANVCESTDGALDITIYPVLREWGFTTGNMHVPSEEDIASALAKTGYRDIGISGNTVTIPYGYMLDLGSCAKGYSGDEMLEVMSELGINSALVNLGGNVQTLGSKPDGTEWSVGIANLRRLSALFHGRRRQSLYPYPRPAYRSPGGQRACECHSGRRQGDNVRRALDGSVCYGKGACCRLLAREWRF